MINGYFDNVAEYVANGRRLKEPSREMLAEYWLAAFTDVARNPTDVIARSNLNNLTSEFHLRGETPPYWRVKELAQQYIDELDYALRELQKEYPAGWEAANRDLQNAGPVHRIERVVSPPCACSPLRYRLILLGR
jgi:hypothetical protein